jgi:kynurenine formamidase
LRHFPRTRRHVIHHVMAPRAQRVLHRVQHLAERGMVQVVLTSLKHMSVSGCPIYLVALFT